MLAFQRIPFFHGQKLLNFIQNKRVDSTRVADLDVLKDLRNVVMNRSLLSLDTGTIVGKALASIGSSFGRPCISGTR